MLWLWPTLIGLRAAFVVVATVVAFREAAKFQRDGGKSPWGWSPTVWAIIAAFLTFFGGVVGLVVAALVLTGAQASTEHNAPRPGAFEMTPTRLRWMGALIAVVMVITVGLLAHSQPSNQLPDASKQITTPGSERITLRNAMSGVSDRIAQAENAYAIKNHEYLTVPRATGKLTIGEVAVGLPSGVDGRISTSADGSRLCVVLHSAAVGAVAEQNVVWLKNGGQKPEVTDCPKGYGTRQTQTAAQKKLGARICRPLGAGVVSATATTVGAVRTWALAAAPQLAGQLFSAEAANSAAAWCWLADAGAPGYVATAIDAKGHSFRLGNTESAAIPSGAPSVE
jgi:hypothetical protein